MRKSQFLLFLIVLLQIVGSCKSEFYTTIVTGRVINSVTKQPMEGVTIKISDEIAAGYFFVSGKEATVIDIDTTDSEGYYSVSIKSKIQNVQFVVDKTNYEYFDEDGGAEGLSLSAGIHSINTELKGLAYFNSAFTKSSYPSQNNDSLYLSILSYDNLLDNLLTHETQLYEGKGPFNLWMEGPSLQVLGDRYLRYKLEFTNNGVWQTKIDSVFLPTSPDVYTQTIYY